LGTKYLRSFLFHTFIATAEKAEKAEKEGEQ